MYLNVDRKIRGQYPGEILLTGTQSKLLMMGSSVDSIQNFLKPGATWKFVFVTWWHNFLVTKDSIYAKFNGSYLKP